MFTLKKNCLLAALMLAMCFGCEKPEPDFDVAQLNGKCFRGLLIAGDRCSSSSYVQMMGAGTGRKSLYMGKEYANVIRIDNFDEFTDSLRIGGEFFFVVDAGRKNCGKSYPCQMIILESDTPPSNVAVSVCISSLSAVPCGSGK